MKKTFLSIITCLFIAAAAQAQYLETGAKCFEFEFSGLSISTNAGHTGSLLYKYYKSEGFAYRFALGGGFANSSVSTDGGSGRVVTYTTDNWAVSPGFGVEKTIANVNRFNIYACADLVPSFRSQKTTMNNEVTDPIKAGGQSGDYYKTETSNSQTMFGLYPGLGANFFLSKNFSVGAEFSMGLGYTLPYSVNTTSSSRNSGIDNPSVTSKNNVKAGINLNTTSSALITGAFYF